MEIKIELNTSSCCSEIKTTLCCESEPLELNDEGIKEQVKSRYAEAATTGSGCGCTAENPFNLDSYDEMDGYEVIADLGLGFLKEFVSAVGGKCVPWAFVGLCGPPLMHACMH